MCQPQRRNIHIDVQPIASIARLDVRKCHNYNRYRQWFDLSARGVILIVLIVGSLPFAYSASPLLNNLETLTFADWYALYRTVSISMALPALFHNGPVVRAKILVATQITLNDFMSGEAIFRDQICRIAGVASERVNLEDIQTTALQSDARGIYIASVSISALIPPLTLNDTGNTTLVLPFIDQERERIVQALRYGGLDDNGVNKTIGSLHLFDSFMELQDIAIDGELFYPLDFKPWVSATMAVGINGIPSDSLGAMIGPSHVAFQRLRLRFLIVQLLSTLHVDTSSIILRDPVILPSVVYGVSAQLIPIEIHVGEDHVDLYNAVNGLLRNTTRLSNGLPLVEPQWKLLAINADTSVGLISSPTSSSNLLISPTQLTTYQSEIVLQIDNFPILYVQQRSARILDAARIRLTQIIGRADFDLSFGRVVLISSSNDNMNEMVEPGATSIDKSFLDPPPDPIQSMSYTLSFVLSSDMSIMDVSSIQAMLSTMLGSPSEMRFQFGFVEYSGIEGMLYPNGQVTFQQVRPWIELETIDTSRPFVQIVMSLVRTTNALLVRDQPFDVFTWHRIRCAILRTLRQAFVRDIDLVMLPPSILSKGGLSVVATYRVMVQDESQRQLIANLVMSRRLAMTISVYLEGHFSVHDRSVDIRADGSRSISTRLPGTHSNMPLIFTPSEGNIAHPLLASSLIRYGDPDPMVNPNVLAVSTNEAAASACAMDPNNNDNALPYSDCIVLVWDHELPSHLLFARELSVNTSIVSTPVVVTSPNVIFPSPTSPSVLAAPWLDSGTRWVLRVRSPVPTVTLRITMEMADSNVAHTYPAFALSIDLSLSSDPSSSSIQKVSHERLVPFTLSSRTTPSFIVSALSDIMLSADSIVMNDIRTTPVLLLQYKTPSILGLVAFSDKDQPALCTNFFNSNFIYECRSYSTECHAISSCVQSLTLDQDGLFRSSLLRSTNINTINLSSVLRQCFDSSVLYIGIDARMLFIQTIRNLITYSCSIQSIPSPPISSRLILAYTPCQHLITFVSPTFTTTLVFMIDFYGGDGGGHPNSHTVTSRLEGLTESSSMDSIRNMVYNMYGSSDIGGLDIKVTLSIDSNQNTSQILIQYYFLDMGVAHMPFIMVDSGDPAIITTLTAIDELQLVRVPI